MKQFAQENRKHSTEAEMILWDLLKAKQLGVTFKRQHIIGDYIVDFVCIEKWLVIEVDGGYHSEPQQQQDDITRQDRLADMGFSIIRFTNDEIIGNTECVLNEIEQQLEKS